MAGRRRPIGPSTGRSDDPVIHYGHGFHGSDRGRATAGESGRSGIPRAMGRGYSGASALIDGRLGRKPEPVVRPARPVVAVVMRSLNVSVESPGDDRVVPRP